MTIVCKNPESVIGRTFAETSPENGYDWQGVWPEVNINTGIVVAVLDSDTISDDAVLLNYRDGKFVPTDGDYGFDAVQY